MSLSKEELQVVDQHLKDRKVENWDVRYEIVDHMACLIEGLMEEGVGFEDALAEVKKTFTFRYLLKMKNEKQKVLSKYLRRSFVNEFKRKVIDLNFLIKISLLFFVAILLYKYTLVNTLFGMLLLILYSPMFFQIKGMITNYRLYGKSMLMNSVWGQILSLPSMIMFPFYISERFTDKYMVVILILLLCLTPIMLVWNNLLLKEMKKLKEQYFLIYE